jgi:hypothetical protein
LECAAVTLADNRINRLDPNKMFEFYVLPHTGKSLAASAFFDCLIGVAEALEINQCDVRTLSRTATSWFVYRCEADMLTDVAHRRRVNWAAQITREEVKPGLE